VIRSRTLKNHNRAGQVLRLAAQSVGRGKSALVREAADLLTIPCVTGPHTSISAKLTLLSSNFRKDAKAAMESKRDSAEANAKLILKEAVESANVLVAGGAEVGAGLKRADAVREAGLQMLDRQRSAGSFPRCAVACSAFIGVASF
jgi:hypothetical protein